MSRFSGKQYPGALKDLREQRKLEAQHRDVAYQARHEAQTAGDHRQPDGWVQVDDSAHEPRVRSAATRLLNAIFGNPIDREAQP